MSTDDLQYQLFLHLTWQWVLQVGVKVSYNGKKGSIMNIFDPSLRKYVVHVYHIHLPIIVIVLKRQPTAVASVVHVSLAFETTLKDNKY